MIPRFARITRDVQRWKGDKLTLRVMFTDLKPRLVRGSPGRWRALDVYGDAHRCRLYAADKAKLDREYERLLAASLF